jgi:cell division protein FtsW
MTAEYRRNRILKYLGLLDGEKNGTLGEQTSAISEQVSHQINQSLIAIGNGGWTGVGIGQSRQSHRFLPEAHSDFIFAIIGEEYGFIGLFLILLVFGVIFYRGFRAAKNAPDDYGYYLGAGIIIVFATYLIINAGVCTNLLPTTGLPLPFISYGGTALLINSATMGILLNISAQANASPVKKKSKKKKKSKDDEYKEALESQNIQLMIDKEDE